MPLCENWNDTQGTLIAFSSSISVDHARVQAASSKAASSRFGGEGEARGHEGGDGDGEHEAAVSMEFVSASLSHQ